MNELPKPKNEIGWPWTVENSLVNPTQTPNGQSWPRISIVTPSYNQAQYIEATIRSVLLQGYPNLEFFIMDGGSTDGSVEIIRRYDPWITKWVSEPDRGQTHAINKGLSQGSGEIFTWLNSDDILVPNSLFHVAEMYRQNPNAVGWVGGCYLISPEGVLLTTELPRGLTQAELADWYHTGYIFQPSCFFSANAYRKIGGLDESLNYSMDFDLWIRLANEGDYVATDEFLSAAVIHDEAKTQARRADMFAETIAMQIKYGFDEQAAMLINRLMTPPPFSKQLERAVRSRLSPVKQKLPFLKKEKLPLFTPMAIQTTEEDENL